MLQALWLGTRRVTPGFVKCGYRSAEQPHLVILAYEGMLFVFESRHYIEFCEIWILKDRLSIYTAPVSPIIFCR
jgi:hypothetical protein